MMIRIGMALPEQHDGILGGKTAEEFHPVDRTARANVDEVAVHCAGSCRAGHFGSCVERWCKQADGRDRETVCCDPAKQSLGSVLAVPSLPTGVSGRVHSVTPAAIDDAAIHKHHRPPTEATAASAG